MIRSTIYAAGSIRKAGLDFIDRFNRLSDEIVQLQQEDIPPESEKCQQVIKEYRGLIMEFTNGDMRMLPKLMEVGNIDTARTTGKNGKRSSMIMSARRCKFTFPDLA